MNYQHFTDKVKILPTTLAQTKPLSTLQKKRKLEEILIANIDI